MAGRPLEPLSLKPGPGARHSGFVCVVRCSGDLLAAVATTRAGHLRLRGFTNQLVVHLDPEVVGLRIKPRHRRTKRACDAVYAAMD